MQRKGAEVGILQRGREAGRGWWHRMDRADWQMGSTWTVVLDMESGSSGPHACLDGVDWLTPVPSLCLHPGIQDEALLHLKCWEGHSLDLRQAEWVRVL